jgi:site-specific DNA-cytosine methylase
MLALTVCQPVATSMITRRPHSIRPVKPIENRSWAPKNIPDGGLLVAIHAGQKWWRPNGSPTSKYHIGGIGFVRDRWVGPPGEYASARHYGVLRWKDASPAVTGSACHDNGAHSVADPRLPLANEKLDPPPVIISLDGTWHRPFTTLDLAALQGYPVLEQDFRLDGSDSLQREHIGNSVPVPAARAIATTMLRTLLMHELGESFALKAEPIWVNPLLALGVAIGTSIEVSS